MTSTNGQNQSEKHKKLPWWLIGTAIVCAVLALAGAITAFMFRGEKWPETLIISLLVIAFGIPFLLYMDFDEIGLFGLSAKRLKEDIKVVQQRQLMNQSVTTVDATGQEWFWVDEYGKAHKLQDEETALFLARGSGTRKQGQMNLSLMQNFLCLSNRQLQCITKMICSFFTMTLFTISQHWGIFTSLPHGKGVISKTKKSKTGNG